MKTLLTKDSLETTRKIAKALTVKALTNGGATLDGEGNPITDGFLIGGGIIKDGDALAKIKVTDNARLIEARIYWSLIQNRNQLADFTAIGVWLQDDIIYLDAVTVEADFIKAVAKGLTRKQQAIGGLAKGVYTEYSLNN